MLKQKILSITTLLIMLSGVSSQSYASPPYSPDLVTPSNRWELTLYFDQLPSHLRIPLKQSLCFKDIGADAEHELYTWSALPASLGKGNASQEGDQIISSGHLYGLDVDMQWEIYTRDEGAGHLRAWFPSDTSTAYTINITMIRDAKPCP
jgi:hypothetical protein